MNRTLRQLILPALALVALAAPAPAAADWRAVLQDCVLNEGLEGDYKKSELQEAKRRVTGERVAYTECVAEISAAMNAAGGGGDGQGGGAGGGSAATDADLNDDGKVTPAERRAFKRKQAREKDEIASINDSLTPDSGSAAGGDGGGGSDGPSPGLIVGLIALVLAAIGGGLWYAADRNPAFANALRRVPLPGRRG